MKNNSIDLTTICFLVLSFGFIAFMAYLGITHDEKELQNLNSTDYVAVLVTTNLVSVPCMGGTDGGTCEWCKQEIGMRIPEHMNQLNYDLKIVISTNYLPIIKK